MRKEEGEEEKRRGGGKYTEGLARYSRRLALSKLFTEQFKPWSHQALLLKAQQPKTLLINPRSLQLVYSVQNTSNFSQVLEESTN